VYFAVFQGDHLFKLNHKSRFKEVPHYIRFSMQLTKLHLAAKTTQTRSRAATLLMPRGM